MTGPYEFKLVVDRVPADDQVEALFGLADEPSVESAPGEGAGLVWCTRPAATLAEAVADAVVGTEAVGLRPVRVEAQDWLTLDDVAGRVGRSRTAVRHWSTGEQGPGGFPPPFVAGHRDALWSWRQVRRWLREQLGYDLPDDEAVLAAASLALQLRTLAPRVGDLAGIRRLLP